MAMHTEKLHRKLDEWKGQDHDRASEAGEQRADIKDFLELTGWNKTALSFIRKLDKMEDDKRNDILRSLDDLRQEMQSVWDEGDTPDMFGHNSKPEADAVDFADESEPSSDDPETSEFNDAVDDVSDDDGNVVPFDEGAA